MAEFVLSKLAESVVAQSVQRISDLLIYEAASLRSVRDDVVVLQDELRSLKGFLKEADSKQEQDERLRDLLIQVREIASDAEDVVETFIFKVSSSYMKASHNKRIRAQINSIRSRIQIIFRTMQIFEIKFVVGGGTSSSMVELQRNLRRSYPHDEDNDVIRLEGSKAALTAQLTKEEDRLCIVSVVGMGGLGKTTLAKKVYNGVKQHFDCCTWVFISQQCVPRDVSIEILIQVGTPYEKKNVERNKYGREVLEEMKNEREKLNALKEHELINLLKNELEQKRYLVVLDDIWKVEDWYRIQHAFPHGKKGSKLLFTTRNMEVATSADRLSSPIIPPFLNDDESWELLRRKAFPKDIVGHGEKDCSPEFENLGREMVKKCGGLPLAVVVLGGLLKTKNSLDEWKVVHRNVNAHLKKPQSRQQYGGVHDILALSYYDLPYTLKPCFLYLGNFPEDWEIPKRKLIRLWIAEGFIAAPTRGVEEETMEDIAEQYLRELIHRGMVQVGQRDYTGVGVKTCRMHDLMRDFCKLKAREENFSEIIQKIESSTNSSKQHVATTHSRRIAISPGCVLDFNTNCLSSLLRQNVEYASWKEQIHPHLRSLLCFGTFSFSALATKNFSALRVLEMEPVKSMKMPREIGKLVHLKYLCLKTSWGMKLKLPKTIGNLRNLHTLDLDQCWCINLPREIFNLVRLRHLLLPKYPSNPFHVMIARLFGPKIHFGVNRLTNIVTLKYIPAEWLIKNDALLKLTNLQNLGIVLDSDGEVGACLRSWNVFVPSAKRGFKSLEPLSSCHSLSELRLRGRVSKEVDSIGCHILHCLPANLNKLVLYGTRLQQDPMPVLEKLSNLRCLKLKWYAYEGDELVCSAYGFPKLERLQFVDLFWLREWHVEEGALQNLKRLDIQILPNMKMMPDGLRFVTCLRELNIKRMPKSFCERLQVKDGNEGADYYKVRHIPSISISSH
ncbi:hypothetical protein FNV43_RR25175 [Rhamnella rubrinervis]|uniref:Uncharacterized protein n=1 Tax=Rhamnella rubrinervis TaxID=2594499 RepID=A0A8K0DMW1_9ROSA|nr:hypothetical protein FNV43_RR25175 [Rhamnella rubrinervis]